MVSKGNLIEWWFKALTMTSNNEVKDASSKQEPEKGTTMYPIFQPNVHYTYSIFQIQYFKGISLSNTTSFSYSDSEYNYIQHRTCDSQPLVEIFVNTVDRRYAQKWFIQMLNPFGNVFDVCTLSFILSIELNVDNLFTNIYLISYLEVLFYNFI